ncbi:hypothetical protein C8J56DRAFT_803346, partial [Mycena floridula]
LASGKQLNFNQPHAPTENAIAAFNQALPKIKAEIVKSCQPNSRQDSSPCHR